MHVCILTGRSYSAYKSLFRNKMHYILSSFNSVPINSYNLVYDYMISFRSPLHVKYYFEVENIYAIVLRNI